MKLIAIRNLRKHAQSDSYHLRTFDLDVTFKNGNGITETHPYTWVEGDTEGLGPQMDNVIPFMLERGEEAAEYIEPIIPIEQLIVTARQFRIAIFRGGFTDILTEKLKDEDLIDYEYKTQFFYDDDTKRILSYFLKPEDYESFWRTVYTVI